MHSFIIIRVFLWLLKPLLRLIWFINIVTFDASLAVWACQCGREAWFVDLSLVGESICGFNFSICRVSVSHTRALDCGFIFEVSCITSWTWSSFRWFFEQILKVLKDVFGNTFISFSSEWICTILQWPVQLDGKVRISNIYFLFFI